MFIISLVLILGYHVIFNYKLTPMIFEIYFRFKNKTIENIEYIGTSVKISLFKYLFVKKDDFF